MSTSSIDYRLEIKFVVLVCKPQAVDHFARTRSRISFRLSDGRKSVRVTCVNSALILNHRTSLSTNCCIFKDLSTFLLHYPLSFEYHFNSKRLSAMQMPQKGFLKEDCESNALHCLPNRWKIYWNLNFKIEIAASKCVFLHAPFSLLAFFSFLFFALATYQCVFVSLSLLPLLSIHSHGAYKYKTVNPF